MGRLDPPLAHPVRAGEGPGLVAEQLCLDHGVRQGGGVDRNEGAVLPAAEIMQRLGDDFLAGSRFPGDQHGRVGGGEMQDPLAQGSHRRAVAEKPAFQARSVFQAPGQRPVFQNEGTLFHRAAHDLGHIVRIERLFDEIIGAVAHRLDGHGDIAMASDQDHRNFRVDLPDPAHQTDPVFSLQHHVGHDTAREAGGNLADRLMGACRLDRAEIGQSHPLPQGGAHRWIIIDDQNRGLS